MPGDGGSKFRQRDAGPPFKFSLKEEVDGTVTAYKSTTKEDKGEASHRKRFKIDEALLAQPKVMEELRRSVPSAAFRRSNPDLKSTLKELVDRFECWAHSLCPNVAFHEFIDRLEVLSFSKFCKEAKSPEDVHGFVQSEPNQELNAPEVIVSNTTLAKPSSTSGGVSLFCDRDVSTRSREDVSTPTSQDDSDEVPLPKTTKCKKHLQFDVLD